MGCSDVEAAAAPVRKDLAVGATWAASKLAGLNMMKWLQPREDPLDGSGCPGFLWSADPL